MAMGNDKQVCRLCLDIVQLTEGEAIEDVIKGMLDKLHVNVDLHISDNPMACNRCLEELQRCIDFTSACFYVNDYIEFVDADGSVDMENFERETRQRCKGNLQICRLCVSVIEDQAPRCNTLLKDMIANCLPEVDLNTAKPLICRGCLGSMKRLNKFMKTCQEVERKIKDYRQAATGDAVSDKIVLRDLLDYKNYDILTKPIDEDCEDFDMDEMESPETENTARIECEEIHIKDEPIEEQSFNGKKKYKCRYCNLKCNDKGNLGKHIAAIHEREKATVHACPQCPYKTVRTSSLRRHVKLHEDKSPHKCPSCKKGYSEKRTLDNHLLKKHKNLRHLIASRIYDCKFCTFKSTIAINVRRHIVVKHKRQDAEKFHCHHCNYFTLQKDNLITHLTVHSSSRLHQCPSCNKGFNNKWNLDAHILTSHQENAVLLKTIKRKIFDCTLCHFKTVGETALRRHVKASHK